MTGMPDDLRRMLDRERVNARAVVASLQEHLHDFLLTIDTDLGPDKDIARQVAESALGLIAVSSRSTAYRRAVLLGEKAAADHA